MSEIPQTRNQMYGKFSGVRTSPTSDSDTPGLPKKPHQKLMHLDKLTTVSSPITPIAAISHLLRPIGATTPPFLPIPASTAAMEPQHEDPTKTIVPGVGGPDHGGCPQGRIRGTQHPTRQGEEEEDGRCDGGRSGQTSSGKECRQAGAALAVPTKAALLLRIDHFIFMSIL